MRLCTFEFRSGLGPVRRLGVQVGDDLVCDAQMAYARLLLHRGAAWEGARRISEATIPSDMLAFLETGSLAMQAVREALEDATSDRQSPFDALFGPNGARVFYSLRDDATVRLLAPLPRVSSLRDFLAFEEHVRKGYERRNQPFPELWNRLPVYYKGNPRSILGPDEPMQWPTFTQKLDYELEIGCVIGREGRDISERDAPLYIAGYTILNDWSARDIQMEEMQLRLGPSKGKDFGTSLGPWLVTPDEVVDPRNLKMVARINGEVWSEGNSGASHWTFPQLISHVSRDETLYPGDVLGSGTVGGGCGYELDRWILPGDTVELEIDGLGILRSVVLAPTAPFQPLSKANEATK